MARGTTLRSEIGLSREQRVTRTAQFREAYDQNRKTVGRYVVVWLRRGPDAALRLGVVSSRKVGGAVQRNRARRRVRETYRRLRPELRGEADVIMAVRATLANATGDELAGDLRRVLKRAGLLPETAAAPTGEGAGKAP